MTDQPEALRLADELEALRVSDAREMWLLGEPAARLLREQHAEIERLREQLRLANIDALNEAVESERLRQVLKNIETLKVTVDGFPVGAYQTEGWMRELAREALEDKS